MAAISIEQGPLIGNIATTATGFQYHEYLHIPYAKPPLGDLRFKAPQPPDPWEGVFNAKTASDKNICLQFDIVSRKTRGSEDCLYLNVYTPQIPKPGLSLLPVMVYLHYGGFNFGSGTLKGEGGPDYLIENDVVIVSLNYRLTIFGFLNLHTPDASGNMGLKDQVMALKWVRKNIHKFGGNKDDVTIFGASAGSASVQYHTLSSLSTGLFHKAIQQSGSALNHWAIDYFNDKLVDDICKELGYTGSKNASSILKFLVEQPTEVLMAANLKHASIAVLKGLDFGFAPTVEDDFGNGEAFITEHPYKILKQGKINIVNSLIGFNEHEGLLIKGCKPTAVKELYDDKNFTAFWTYPLNEEDTSDYQTRFKNEYAGKDSSMNFATDFFTDFDIVAGVWTASEILASRGVPIFEYKFTYDGKLNILKVLCNLKDKGAGHIDDTGYLLSYDIYRNKALDVRDKIMKHRLTTMWTNFAKTGHPTPYTDNWIPIEWPLFDNVTKLHLKIDDRMEILSDYKPEKTALFRQLYEKYEK